MANQVMQDARNDLEQINRDELKDIETLSPRIDQHISDKVASFFS